MGSQYDARVFYRIRFTFVEEPTGTRVYGGGGYVTNYRSAFERENPMSAKDAQQMQAMLERLRDQVAVGT